MLRSFVERMSRGRSFRTRLPPAFGGRSLVVSPDSALSFLKPNWQKLASDLLNVAERHVQADQSVWDIGANVGVFGFAAAHRVGPGGQALFLEADPFLASLLQRSALLNVDLGVSVVCAAASSQNGIARFLIAARGRASNSLEQAGHRSTAGGTRYVQHVPTLTLDSLLHDFRPPDLIKIDVEGAEALVLAGATQVLSAIRPIFYIEVGDPQKTLVTKILKENEYDLYDGDSEDETSLKQCTWNTLAVPREKSFNRQKRS
jgi:FkbM family methyltransferase